MREVLGVNAEGQEDRDYWNDKYAEATCHTHGDVMYYDEDEAEWRCPDCEENEVAYLHG